MAIVYRYDYLDRQLMRERRSEDYATADAVDRLGGRVVVDTRREIDDAKVDAWGLVRPQDMADSRPAPMPAPEPRQPADRSAHEARPADVVHDEIDIRNPDQVRDWTLSLGVSTAALEDAVRAVGPRIEQVRAYLGNIQT